MNAIPAAPTARRSLAAREHGAYFQLAAPLVTVLLAGRPSVAGVCLALAAALAFVAHEPLLVVLGQRGTRALREHGGHAKRRLVISAASAMMLAIVAWTSAPAIGPWLSVPAVLVAIAFAFIVRRRERTLIGELVASTALASAALPVAIACHVDAGVSLAVCGVFALGSALSTIEVRAIARRESLPRVRLVAWASSIGVLVALARLSVAWPLAALPTVGVLAFVAATKPGPKDLRRVGWALASGSFVTSVALVVVARALS